jgi:hypothetical protein
MIDQRMSAFLWGRHLAYFPASSFRAARGAKRQADETPAPQQRQAGDDLPANAQLRELMAQAGGNARRTSGFAPPTCLQFVSRIPLRFHEIRSPFERLA